MCLALARYLHRSSRLILPAPLGRAPILWVRRLRLRKVDTCGKRWGCGSQPLPDALDLLVVLPARHWETEVPGACSPRSGRRRAGVPGCMAAAELAGVRGGGCHWASHRGPAGSEWLCPCHSLLPPALCFPSSLGSGWCHLCGNPTGRSLCCPGSKRYPSVHLSNLLPQPRRIHPLGQASEEPFGKHP